MLFFSQLCVDCLLFSPLNRQISTQLFLFLFFFFIWSVAVQKQLLFDYYAFEAFCFKKPSLFESTKIIVQVFLRMLHYYAIPHLYHVDISQIVESKQESTVDISKKLQHDHQIPKISKCQR